IDSVKNANCNSNNGGAFLSISNANNPVFSWSTGTSTEDLQNVAAGTYTVTVSENGCTKAAQIQISQEKPNPIEICMVTVDDTTGRNLVVFDKTLAETSVTRFNIYCE